MNIFHRWIMVVLIGLAGQQVRAATLENGANATGFISGVGASESWTFTAAAGDYVMLRCAAANYQSRLTLYAPGGAAAADQVGSEAVISGVLSLSGTYTVVVRAYLSGTGGYVLRRASVPGGFVVPDDDEGGVAEFGEALGEITVGDIDLWTFEVGEGEELRVVVGSEDFSAYATLHGPDGAAIDADYGTEVVFIAEGIAKGTYTVVVSSHWWGGKGTYAVYGLSAKAQTITFPALANRAYTPVPFELGATASSGLPIVYTVVEGPATVEGNTLKLIGVGMVTVRASQAGDGVYFAASAVEQTFSVTKAAQTLTFAEIADQVWGAGPIALSASASSGLPVTFSMYSGPATLSGGKLTITGTGTVVVGAAQLGNAVYAATSVVERTFEVRAKPVILKHPQDTTVVVGEQLLLKLSIDGSNVPRPPRNPDVSPKSPGRGEPTDEEPLPPPFTYQWRKNGKDISGATKGFYKVDAVATKDAGTYTVVVTNMAGSVTSEPAVVKVTIPEPQITAPPASMSVTVGASLSLTVTATGAGLKYQWFKDGKKIPDATKKSYAVAKVGTSHAGSYTVKVSNPGGSVTSAAAVVTIKVTKPKITTSPKSVSVKEGGSVTLKVAATGAGLKYQWFKDGKKISGATKATYAVEKAAASHAGSYTVKVSNPGGSVTSAAAKVTVTVGKPKIVTGPKAVTAKEGKSFALKVAATGTKLKYQWFKNGKKISGATQPTYSVGKAAAAHAGTYTVTVSNSGGSVTSKAVKVVVGGK